MATGARFLVLWSSPADPEEFDRHYREVHVPLVRSLPGLRRYTLSRGTAPVRGDDTCHLVAELDFDDMAALQKAFQSPQGQATAADAAHLARGAGVHSVVYELEDAL